MSRLAVNLILTGATELGDQFIPMQIMVRGTVL